MADDPDGDSAPEPADALPADPLLSFALGGFHAALLVVAGVLAIHLDGRAGYLLQGLSTAAGFAAYLGLWATTWWSARRWLRDGGDLVAAFKWGATNGLVVFAPGYVGLVAIVVINAGSLAFLLIALGVGALLAVALGALVGGILGLLDRGLLRLGWRLVA